VGYVFTNSPEEHKHWLNIKREFTRGATSSTCTTTTLCLPTATDRETESNAVLAAHAL
jgi:hypothetical protein